MSWYEERMKQEARAKDTELLREDYLVVPKEVRDKVNLYMVQIAEARRTARELAEMSMGQATLGLAR